MAARRRFPRRSFRRFSRARLKPPLAQQKWQWANFAFDAQASLQAGTFLIHSVELLKVADHVGTGSTGNVFESLTRRIEVGGIVYDFGTGFAGGAGDPDNPSDAYLFGELLVIDRLAISGAPEGLPDWNSTLAPVSTAPTVEEQDFPTRVLHRYFDRQTSLAGLVSTPLTNGQARYNRPMRTQNLRLRRFLDDRHGLFLNFYHLIDGVSAADTDVDYWAYGSIFYRWRFGG